MDGSDTVTPERLTFIARVEVEKEGVQSPSTIKNEFVFIKKSMSKDGDCFYHCIIEGTPGSNWDYKKLRDRVANVLKGRAADFVPDNYTGTVTTQALTYEQWVNMEKPFNHNWSNYLEGIRDDQWADHIVMCLMPQIVQKCIIVYSRKRNVHPCYSN